MTNEQLTQEVVRLAEHQAKCDAERDMVYDRIDKLEEEVKTMKSLAEDVHIMVIKMQGMEETIENTNRKVDALVSDEYIKYKNNKDLIREKIIGTIAVGIAGGMLAFLVWFVTNFVKGGGV